ncbi:MAG TPA: hypothetical protein VNU68_09710 [Verrucomicrobiae bacterium]|nr:hypothetical protein [Verrucomicrobiae bacterium]
MDLYGVGRTVSSAQSQPYMFPFDDSQKLCVDMVGNAHSVTSEVHLGGKLESRKYFLLVAGAPYRLSFKMSGQQRHPGADRGIKVKIQGNGLLEQDFGPVAFDFPFTTFSADVTGDGLPHKLGFECLPYFAEIPTGAFGGYVEDTWGGNLLDDIKLERLDTAEILLDDDFNTENDG